MIDGEIARSFAPVLPKLVEGFFLYWGGRARSRLVDEQLSEIRRDLAETREKQEIREMGDRLSRCLRNGRGDGQSPPYRLRLRVLAEPARLPPPALPENR